MAKYTAQMNFVTEQLDAAGYYWNGSHNFKIRKVVEEMFREFEAKGLSEEEAQEALRIIYMLGSTLSLAPEGYTIQRNISWIPLVEGRDRVGELCRVSPEAYEGQNEALNGKVGTISGFLPNGQVRVYLRTFAGSVQVAPGDLEVVKKLRF